MRLKHQSKVRICWLWFSLVGWTWQLPSSAWSHQDHWHSTQHTQEHSLGLCTCHQYLIQCLKLLKIHFKKKYNFSVNHFTAMMFKALKLAQNYHLMCNKLIEPLYKIDCSWKTNQHSSNKEIILLHYNWHNKFNWNLSHTSFNNNKVFNIIVCCSTWWCWWSN